MRLSEEQVKQGILHSDPRVRFAALEYFANAFSRDRTVMPVAIEAFERFGRNDAFAYTFPIAELAQTPETIRWAIAELRQAGEAKSGESYFFDSVARLLCDADPELILPYETEILELLEFKPPLRQELSWRLRAHALDDEACWQEIEAICESDKNKVYVNETRYSEALHIAEALARRSDRYADRVMALLAEKIEDFEDNPMTWMEPIVVYMAGEMRYEPATPLVIGKLQEDGEILNDECLYALAKIGTDSVVRGLGEAFPTAEWAFRLFTTGVLGRVHSDLAVETCSRLLEAEEDIEIRSQLAVALTDQFSTEGNELARQALLDESVDPVELLESLVASCTLAGQDFPELPEWRRELDRPRRRIEAIQRTMKRASFDEDLAEPSYRFDDAAPPAFSPTAPLRSQKGPGRNDPCPCGSGKKYKQCCLRKQAMLE